MPIYPIKFSALPQVTAPAHTDFLPVDRASLAWPKIITVENFRGMLNVKDFGALGDNSTDDTTAIQAAIDAAMSTGSGVPSFGRVYLPAGIYRISQLVLQNRVWLVGADWESVILKQISGSNQHCIINHVSINGTTDPNAEYTGLMNLTIDGQGGSEGGGNTSGDGVYFDMNPRSGAMASGDDTWDACQTLTQVRIINCAGNGYNDALHGGVESSCRSDNRLTNVLVKDCKGHGFVPSYDEHLVNCSAGVNGLSGFYILSNPVHLLRCNAYYSGQVNQFPNGMGFQIKANGGGGVVMLDHCYAQDNENSGFNLDTTNGVILSACGADSNSNWRNPGVYPGVDLWNARNSMIDVVCIDRSGGNTTQRNALRMRNDCTGSQIRIQHINVAGGLLFGPPLSADSEAGAVLGTHVEVRASEGTQAPAFATPFVADPYLGGHIFMTLTGAITVNSPLHEHPGAELEFIFLQDGTGGWNVTWDTTYFKTNWTNTGNTANKRSSIKFRFDGSDWGSHKFWVQVGGINSWF